MYNGAMVAALTEVMPVYVAYRWFLRWPLAGDGNFGGLTPAISTALVKLTVIKLARLVADIAQRYVGLCRDGVLLYL